MTLCMKVGRTLCLDLLKRKKELPIVTSKLIVLDQDFGRKRNHYIYVYIRQDIITNFLLRQAENLRSQLCELGGGRPTLTDSNRQGRNRQAGRGVGEKPSVLILSCVHSVYCVSGAWTVLAEDRTGGQGKRAPVPDLWTCLNHGNRKQTTTCIFSPNCSMFCDRHSCNQKPLCWCGDRQTDRTGTGNLPHCSCGTACGKQARRERRPEDYVYSMKGLSENWRTAVEEQREGRKEEKKSRVPGGKEALCMCWYNLGEQWLSGTSCWAVCAKPFRQTDVGRKRTCCYELCVKEEHLIDDLNSDSMEGRKERRQTWQKTLCVC